MLTVEVSSPAVVLFEQDSQSVGYLLILPFPMLRFSWIYHGLIEIVGLVQSLVAPLG